MDKTLLIRDFLDTKPMVSLFTRPRRFGKTMNMDMLRVFFEKTAEDTSIYFRDKQIWQCGDFYTQHQGNTSNLPDVQGREVLNLGGNLSENTNIDFLGIHAAQ